MRGTGFAALQQASEARAERHLERGDKARAVLEAQHELGAARQHDQVCARPRAAPCTRVTTPLTIGATLPGQGEQGEPSRHVLHIDARSKSAGS